jgi:hypothetical protein
MMLDPSIKYCGFDYAGKSMASFIEYISLFRVFPAIEMYAKNKILYLSSDSRFYKKFTKSKEFATYVRNNLTCIQDKMPNYVEILKALRYGLSVKEYIDAMYIYNLQGYAGNESILTKKVVDKIVSLYPNSSIYLDYFNAAKHFIYMDTAKALYPENLQEAHNYYTEKYNSQKEQIKNEEFEKVSKGWEWLNWGNKELMIRVAPNLPSLTTEGQILHHCVGYMNYDERMAEGGNLIMFIRKVDKPGDPFYTVEFNHKTKEIVQCHGDHNALATNEVSEFLNKWLSKIPQLKNQFEKEIVIPDIYQQNQLSPQG